jgi:hypothetical protein
MKNKNLPSQKTREQIAEAKPNQKNLLKELQTKLEYQLRKEKKESEKLKIKNDFNKLNNFSSGNINWVLKKNQFGHYPVWEGYYQGIHLFNINQKKSYYELSFINMNEKSFEFKLIQEKAELFLKSLFKK